MKTLLVLALLIMGLSAEAATFTRVQEGDYTTRDVQIPASCIKLAARKNKPLNTPEEIRAAENGLWALNAKDPLVKECQRAVQKMKDEMQRYLELKGMIQ